MRVSGVICVCGRAGERVCECVDSGREREREKEMQVRMRGGARCVLMCGELLKPYKR